MKLATLAVALPLALAFLPELSALQDYIVAIGQSGTDAYAPGMSGWTARLIGLALGGVGIGLALLAYVASIILPRGR